MKPKEIYIYGCSFVRKLWIISVILFIFSSSFTVYLVSIYKTPVIVSVFKFGYGNTDKDIASISEGFNAHIWDSLCLTNLEDLCKFPIFPLAPTLRVIANSSRVIYPFTDIVVRLFGFIHPPVSGSYSFSVEISSHSSFILTLSTDERPSNSRRLSRNSEQIILKKGKKYFLDLVYNQVKKSSSNVSLTWQKPGDTTFAVVEKKYLSLYLNDSKFRNRKIYDINIPIASFCAKYSARYKPNKLNSYFNWESLNYLSHKEVEKALPPCDYSPSYVVHGRKMKYTWQAIHEYVQYTWIYPFPDWKTVNDPKMWLFALNQTIAEEVVSIYTKRLDQQYPGDYKFLSIRTVEKKEDTKKGSRYLLELSFQRTRDNRTVILSEYVYQQINDSTLCYPVDLQWDKKAEIYFVVTSKDQGRWLQHLINNMGRIYQETNDQHFHLVVFDYSSKDIDIENSLKQGLLQRYTLIRKTGEFIKTKAYNEAVSSVKDPNAIVFLLDLHLEIASDFLDNIRKRCIRGRMTYTPIIIRLGCGSFLDHPSGEWEMYGYGLLGAFKSDWDRFGGYTKHRKGWGGEDWDVMDNVVEANLEFERTRTPYVYHYYHNKKGMWH